MRITFVLPSFELAGGIRVVAIYAERLRQRGHEVLVVAPPIFPIPFRRKVKAWLKGAGWPNYIKADMAYFEKTDVHIRLLDQWRPIVDRDLPDADVIIATWWRTAEWVERLSSSKGAKVYFIQHHEIHEGQPVDRVKATWKLPMHKVTISKWLKELALDQYGDPKVSLVYNSVDMTQFNAVPRSKKKAPTIGFLYSAIKWKGCDISYKALIEVSNRIPDLQVLSFGADLPSNILPIPPKATFFYRPKQDVIKDIYGQCDLWLCGSRTEGFHLPPLEAMACRCPVVSTRVGGPMDIIEEGINGYLVKIEDFRGLAEKAIQILEMSGAEWKKMSDAAYDTATRYTWDDATLFFEKALEAAIERARRGEIAGCPIDR